MADPAPSAQVSDVDVSADFLSFTVTGRGLPTATATVVVELAGTPLSATATAPPVTSASAPSGTVVVVIDASGSMNGARLADARAAADGYADGLPATVRLGLVAVADRPTVLLAPTADRAAFHTAVAGLRAGGGTALYDGICAATELLDGAGERRIVALSDGADTRSVASPADAAARLRGAGAGLDVIAYGSDASGPAIQALAGGTGGRVVHTADLAALRSTFAGMAPIATPVVALRVHAQVPTWLAGADADLTVTMQAGAATVRAPAVRVTVPTAGAPALAPVREPPGWPLTVALTTVAACALLSAAGFRSAMARAAVRRRLRQLDAYGRATAEAQRRSPLQLAVGGAEQVIERRGNRQRLASELDRAGSALRPAEWMLLRAGTVVLGAVVLALLLPPGLGVLLGAVAGWFGPRVYLRVRAARRVCRFADELPEALQLVVSALRSGFSFPQAIAALAQDGQELVAGEFGRALAEIRLGGDLEDALLRVAARNANEDLSWLVLAVRVQREVGGTLSEVLETAVETMRERARLHRHVRALSAEGRLSAWVLSGMPLALAGFMFVIRGEYLRPLYTTPLGLTMLVMAAALMGAGILWMTKVVKVEV
jgi:tight adherence protein B